MFLVGLHAGAARLRRQHLRQPVDPAGIREERLVADVVIEQPPTNPPDGEQVTDVLVLPPDDAAGYLDGQPGGVMGPIVRLAQAMQLV